MTGAGRTFRSLSDQPVTKLEGVGPKKQAALAQLEIENVLDLLTTYPRRWIDRSRQADLADLAEGDEAVVLGVVTRSRSSRMRNGRAMVTLSVDDSTGSMTVVFFNQPWRAKQLPLGAEALFFGKLGRHQNRPQMANPVVDLVVGTVGRKTGKIIPVYPASAKAGLNSWEIGNWVAEALDRAGPMADPLPDTVRGQLDVVDRTSAFHGIHTPQTMDETIPARKRLAFDELFRLQLALVLRRRARERDARAIRHAVSPLEVTRHDQDPLLATVVERFLGFVALRVDRGATTSAGRDLC